MIFFSLSFVFFFLFPFLSLLFYFEHTRLLVEYQRFIAAFLELIKGLGVMDGYPYMDTLDLVCIHIFPTSLFLLLFAFSISYAHDTHSHQNLFW